MNAQNGELITSFGTEGRVDLRDAMERKPANPVGTSNPGQIIDTVVVLPAPFGPGRQPRGRHPRPGTRG